MYKTRGERIAERLCWILLQLYTGNTVSVNDICQRFAVSRRTGQRDLLRVENCNGNYFTWKGKDGKFDKGTS